MDKIQLAKLLNIPENKLLDYKQHPEAEDYSGCEFKFKNQKYFFRAAKVTPKKNGLFVTLWDRNKKGETAPLDASEPFHSLIIFCAELSHKGMFSFTKQTLITNKILHDSTKKQTGKRGFRVYPHWTTPQSKQAVTTKKWQVEHFSKSFTL